MTHEYPNGYVKRELHKGIETIEFFHPQSNSLPGKILHDLASAIRHAGENPM
jgi:methylglutaconyl-CoA hydratase